MATNPFDALINRQGNEHQKVTRANMPEDAKSRQLAGLVRRKKGDPTTPNMHFSGKINWLVRMLASIRVGAFIHSELKDHPARINLQGSDEIRLKEFERRAHELQRLASDLQVDIAKWNKEKKMRRIVE